MRFTFYLFDENVFATPNYPKPSKVDNPIAASFHDLRLSRLVLVTPPRGRVGYVRILVSSQPSGTSGDHPHLSYLFDFI